jgi:hypothetical protein
MHKPLRGNRQSIFFRHHSLALWPEASLVAIVIGGIMFAYSEGGSKRTFAGIIFGLGMALGLSTS